MDFIDNLFETDFAGAKSQDYFKNENLSAGIYKMAINCFENSFASKNINSKMISGTWIKAIIILVIVVFNAALGAKDLVNLLFQLSLPILLITEAVKVTFFYTRINTTYEDFLSLFSDFKQAGNISDKDPEILKIVFRISNYAHMGSDTT